MALNSCSSLAYYLPIQAANILFNYFNTGCKPKVLTLHLESTPCFRHMQRLYSMSILVGSFTLLFVRRVMMSSRFHLRVGLSNRKWKRRKGVCAFPLEPSLLAPSSSMQLLTILESLTSLFEESWNLTQRNICWLTVFFRMQGIGPTSCNCLDLPKRTRSMQGVSWIMFND